MCVCVCVCDSLRFRHKKYKTFFLSFFVTIFLLLFLYFSSIALKKKIGTGYIPESRSIVLEPMGGNIFGHALGIDQVFDYIYIYIYISCRFSSEN